MSSDPTPRYDYIVYIDESGDDGLKAVRPLVATGSSEWLVLSAVVIRAQNETAVKSWTDGIRSKLQKHRSNRIHFAKLSEANKVAVCQEIASLDLRCFVVASNKKNMQGYRNPDAEKIPSQCWFYCWMTRVLLERVTLFVWHRSILEHGEPRLLRLEYSARGGLRYEQMNAYYEWLRMRRDNPVLPWGQIRFDVLNRKLLKVYPHWERDGLLLADAVAGAFYKACDKHHTGACDPQYAKLLKPRMARWPKTHQTSGYGVKLLPGFDRSKLDDDQKEIFSFYGYPRQWWDPEAFS